MTKVATTNVVFLLSVILCIVALFGMISKYQEAKSSYLEIYEDYDVGDYKKVLDRSDSYDHPDMLYLGGNALYRLGQKEADLGKKQKLWQQSINKYILADEQSTHLWIEENKAYVQQKLQELEVSGDEMNSTTDNSNQSASESENGATPQSEGGDGTDGVTSGKKEELTSNEKEFLESAMQALLQQQKDLQPALNRFGEQDSHDIDSFESLADRFFGRQRTSEEKDW